MIYRNVVSAVVRAMSVEGLDSTTKPNWSPKEIDTVRGRSSMPEQMLLDMLVHARLHSKLSALHWNVLMLKYSSVIERKVAAIDLVVPEIVSRAHEGFIKHAVVAWTFPKPKGVTEGKRSGSVLPAEWYDITRWDEDAHSDSTLRRWNRQIRAWLEDRVNEALVEAQQILDDEGLIGEKAA